MQWKMGKRRTEDDVPSVLYHGTGIRELLWILEADRLEAPYSDGDGSPLGVSLTSNPYIARCFAEEACEKAKQGSFAEEYDIGSLPECDLRGCVLELDGVSLVKAGVDLRPFTDQPEYYDHADEAEERALGQIDGLHGHLRAIHFKDEDLEWHRQMYEAAGEMAMCALCDLALKHPMRSETSTVNETCSSMLSP